MCWIKSSQNTLASRCISYFLFVMRTVFYIFSLLGIFYSGLATANLYFSPEMIGGGGETIADLSRFNQEGIQPAGQYTVDIYINNEFKVEKKVNFIALQMNNDSDAAIARTLHDSTGLLACLSVEELEKLGIATQSLHGLTHRHLRCVSPGQYIDNAYMAFNFQKMRLDISVPQAAMKNLARGYIPPERWDNGINAAMINYNFSGSQNHNDSGNTENQYVNLTSGLNLYSWRFRDYRTWSSYRSQHGTYQQWRHIKSYAERPLIGLRSVLQVGDTVTNGDVFDSLNIRGGQIFTDDNMYPDSRRGFAPTVRGHARTNARVNITQNGYTVYQTFVSPGAFVINDLYPVYSSGDLHVTVTEADGGTQSFTVPYSSVPVLQREGRKKYSLIVGHLNASGSGTTKPGVLQGTLIWGLPKNVTVYGGFQYTDNYLAALAGSGLNMGVLGAISADITQARSRLFNGEEYTGQSARFLYARSLNTLGTTFQLTGYRYSTRGFYTLQETAVRSLTGSYHDDERNNRRTHPSYIDYSDHYDLRNNRKSKFQASISQQLGNSNAVFISGTRQTYWNNSVANDSLQAGLNGSYRNINYSVTYSYNRATHRSEADQGFFVSVSLPLSGWSGFDRHPAYATFSSSRESHGNVSNQAGLTGTALQNNTLNWSVSQGQSRDQGNNGNLSVGYQGANANSNIGYSYSEHYRQINYGLSGGLILHSGGITLGQPLGETNILIAAPGMSDIAVENEVGIKTDWRGYAIKPYASVYRENRVALDTSTLDIGSEIEDPVSRVVPTRGAIVRAAFRGHSGHSALINITYHGQPVPFGSDVKAGQSSGIVSDNGQVYLSGIETEGNLRVTWGGKDDEQCSFHYQLPATGKSKIAVIKNAVCR